MEHDVTVIGAGIVGMNVALALQERGFGVHVLDRTGICAETSRRNAGAFAFSEILPLASPGIIKKAPKWLLDPLGPLSVPPAYALQIAPWMLRFWRASWKDRYSGSVAAQYNLMKLSKDALEAQIVDIGGEKLIQREGELQLYEGAREFSGTLLMRNERDRYSVEYSVIEGTEAIAEIQPGLSERFTHAIFTPDWMNTVDPKRWTEHLADVFLERGGSFGKADVVSIAPSESGVVLNTSEGQVQTKRVVIAAGAWSNVLAKSLGERFPLETERGYNTTLAEGAFDLKTQLTFNTHGFVVSRIDGRVRVGGAVELGGLKLPPNYRRAEDMLHKAAKFLPGLDTRNGEQWMGFRPSMPDSLPVIGCSAKSSNILYAFGHGHLGLTQAAGTAQLVADVVANARPAISLEPYSPNRFRSL